MTERGTLDDMEPHPAAYAAKAWIRQLGPVNLAQFQETLASSALSGNRPAEICCETLRRLLNNEPVSDRYLLGLAWVLRDMDESIKDAKFRDGVMAIFNKPKRGKK